MGLLLLVLLVVILVVWKVCIVGFDGVVNVRWKLLLGGVVLGVRLSSSRF